MMHGKKSGILLHPISVPSKYGIGDFGSEAFEFVDFLYDSSQHLWQILPLGPTAFGNSPYSSISAFAGNELMISPEKIADIGLIEEMDLTSFRVETPKINYLSVYENKFAILLLAYQNFLENVGTISIDHFVIENEDWLSDYAIFRALKDHYNQEKWSDWPNPIKNRDPKSIQKFEVKLTTRINFYKFCQYIFDLQWQNLKNYANNCEIEIIGDLPIYVAYDSADVWSHPQLFELDLEKQLQHVAGVPPDDFSSTGQLWGNPLYNWLNHEKTQYLWWKSRIRRSYEIFDVLRFDHYRGFIEYWKIPVTNSTAVSGDWMRGPGDKFLKVIHQEFKDNLVIVEDPSGVMNPELFELRDKYGFMGMRILQNGFNQDQDPQNIFLPHNYITNSIVYTGTHDNEPILGWLENLDPSVRDHFEEYTNSDGSNANWVLIDLALKSKSKFAVFQLQDILSLDNSARMNIPGTSENNWIWKYRADDLTKGLRVKLRSLTQQAGRS